MRGLRLLKLYLLFLPCKIFMTFRSIKDIILHSFTLFFTMDFIAYIKQIVHLTHRVSDLFY